MAYKEFEVTKLYYSISEVAEMLKVSASLLRFWETEFDILKPKKNRQGNRLFTDEDIKNLRVIHHLVRERGFTLEGAKKKLKENRETTLHNTEVIQSLKKLRSFLVEVKESLGEAPEQVGIEQTTIEQSSIEQIVVEQPVAEFKVAVEQMPTAETVVEEIQAAQTETEQSAKEFLKLPFDFSGFPSETDHE
ncbi:MAG: MerR family transcriptional regulator [Chitinophagales bacterium]|nr:MerR family transcriptional regulator [Chitinophagales bacterium]